MPPSFDARSSPRTREEASSHQGRWKGRRVLTVIVAVVIAPIIFLAFWIPMEPPDDPQQVSPREVITQEDVQSTPTDTTSAQSP